MEIKVDARGRFTIPKAILDHCALKAGDRIQFAIESNGGASLRRAEPRTVRRTRKL